MVCDKCEKKLGSVRDGAGLVGLTTKGWTVCRRGLCLPSLLAALM
jgi:hypothetical protein